MSKKNQEKNESKGPVARDSNPERYGNGGATEQGAANENQASRDGAGDSNVGSEQTGPDSSNGAQSAAAGETGGANPGTAAPQDAVREEATGEVAGRQTERDPIIDADPGDEAFMREHGAGERSIDRSEDFNQERDVAIEGIQDGPGGRKYLILNLTDDTEAQKAAGAYAEAISKDPSKKELAAQLFRLAGVNVGRR